MATQYIIEKSLRSLQAAGIGLKGNPDINEEMVGVYMMALASVDDEQLKAATRKIIEFGLDDDIKALSAPVLRKLCVTQSRMPENTSYKPLSADRQIEDPSQQPMTAAEWKSKNPEKFAWMMDKIKSGNNKFGKFGGHFATAAKDLGLIGAKPASPAPRFSSVAEAKKELESRSPEVQAKIKQLAEIKQKIEFAEAWCEEKKDLDHNTAKKAAERLSAIYAESNLLEEELNKLGVCA